MGLRHLNVWSHLTPYLVFCCIVFLQGALLFGIDTGSFGSLQALPSFLNQFGVQDSSGQSSLPATRKALLNSLPWTGKICGCLIAERLIETFGYKKTAYFAASIQVVAIIIEITSRQWVQFSIGRIIAYFAVALCENLTPAYNAELAPAAARGLLSGSLVMITSLGNLWGSGMSRAYSTTTANKGWMIPTAMQFIPAVGLLLLVPFTVESPRWLVLKGRKEAAKTSLDKVRPQRDIESGATSAEIDALQLLIEESLENEKGSWLEIFKGNYLRRTWIAATIFVVEQMNGNQFVQSYAATFYVQEGLGSKSFTYATVGQVVGVVGCVFAVLSFDIIGRRPLFICGSVACAFFLYLAAGLGLKPNPNQNEVNTIIACFTLLAASTRISAGTICFLTGAEIGGVRMRKKIMAFGTACDVLAAFLVTFVTPYLLPTMGVNIGWIFGSVALFASIWGFFFFPELKRRSLEEVDELFAANIPAWQFSKYQTHGTGRLLATLENEGTVGEKGHIQEADDQRVETVEGS